LADYLGRRVSLEIGYPVRQRLGALARDSVPKECNLCNSENTLSGVEQDPVGLYLPEQDPEVLLVLIS
jgi:hypothetical protein